MKKYILSYNLSLKNGSRSIISQVWDQIWGYQREVGGKLYQTNGVMARWVDNQRKRVIGTKKLSRNTYVVPENVILELQELLSQQPKFGKYIQYYEVK